jgi:DNA-binding CsgD family transcriptional regulator
MRALRASDLAELSEVAERADVADFDAGVLELLRRHVGFDVALFRRKGDYGRVSVGFDPGLLRAAAPHWRMFIEEWYRLGGEAHVDRHGGVMSDLEMYGEQRFRRLAAYRLFAKPAGDIRCVSLLSRWQGRTVAHLMLGRGQRGRFRDRELDRLRAFAPLIRMSEALRYAQGRVPEAQPSLVPATPAALDSARAAVLSSRERQVASYLELGYSNHQIAVACGTSVYTVRNQLSSAYAKLGVATRAEAVRALLRPQR